MLDLLGHCHLLADGATTLEVWSTRHFPERASSPLLGGLNLLGVVRRLLLEPGNRRVIEALVEDERWYASPMFALDEIFAELLERGIIGLRYRVGHESGVFGGGAGSAVSTPVEPAEPLVRPGIDDVSEPTFIEVALRDDAMPSVFADYVLQTDGTPRPGQFIDERVKRIEPIDPRANCSIVLEHIPVPYRPVPQPVPHPASPVRSPHELQVIIRDESGEPVPVQVCQILCDGEPAHEAPYEGTPVHLGTVAAGARYTVALHGLHLPITKVAA